MRDPATFLAPLECDAGEFVIRAYRVGDGPALARSVTESYEHLVEWMPWAQPERGVEEAERDVRRFLARYLLNEDFVMGIWEGERLVGGTGFHLRVGSPASGNAEIGMWIHADFAGKGLGTRVLCTMLEWGLGEWGWERLVWRCAVTNHASRRVAEKAGMTLEGIARREIEHNDRRHDVMVFAMVNRPGELDDRSLNGDARP